MQQGLYHLGCHRSTGTQSAQRLYPHPTTAMRLQTRKAKGRGTYMLVSLMRLTAMSQHSTLCMWAIYIPNMEHASDLHQLSSPSSSTVIPPHLILRSADANLTIHSPAQAQLRKKLQKQTRQRKKAIGLDRELTCVASSTPPHK